jgi:hypothetical protein
MFKFYESYSIYKKGIMILIAHRGNIYGRNEGRENTPTYIIEALLQGYDVEIDVWYINDELFLGHDDPMYKIEYNFITQPSLWIHCKTVETLIYLSSNPSLNAFFHKDDVAITTHGYLFTAPGLTLSNRSIAVMPELVDDWDIGHAFGVCSDYPNKWT